MAHLQVTVPIRLPLRGALPSALRRRQLLPQNGFNRRLCSPPLALPLIIFTLTVNCIPHFSDEIRCLD